MSIVRPCRMTLQVGADSAKSDWMAFSALKSCQKLANRQQCPIVLIIAGGNIKETTVQECIIVAVVTVVAFIKSNGKAACRRR